MGLYLHTNMRNTNILVIEDTFTRWVEAFPIGDPKAPTIVCLLEEQVFFRYDYHKIILIDNGLQFTSWKWKQVATIPAPILLRDAFRKLTRGCLLVSRAARILSGRSIYQPCSVHEVYAKPGVAWLRVTFAR